ncbi:hypothetical protein KGM_214645 [Danaus plexippus plexippus]|uniref:Uncharacterized protein n=1 Tax=Danaus plexippus plexippus TaxID=278856 RepID=A0A212F914_DANPL|nr:hypothetical protein KGM_214645 [Danaus plexippus plexippus]
MIYDFLGNLSIPSADSADSPILEEAGESGSEQKPKPLVKYGELVILGSKHYSGNSSVGRMFVNSSCIRDGSELLFTFLVRFNLITEMHNVLIQDSSVIHLLCSVLF